MPTGYTDKIKDGITFNEFALICARAMGATITMRDDPFNKEIPEKFEPSDYHVKALKKINEEINGLAGITPSSASEKAQDDYETEKLRLETSIQDGIDLRTQYETMLRSVKAWEPPTLGHVGLKDFMIEQIEGSIKHDCHSKYSIESLEKLSPLTDQQWIDKKRASLYQNLDYHTKENFKELKRTSSRTKWIQNLRASL